MSFFLSSCPVRFFPFTLPQRFSFFLFVVVSFLSTQAVQGQAKHMKLWYKAPAGTVWEAALPGVRKLIFEGKYKEASDLAAKTIQSDSINGVDFQPVGDLTIAFPGHTGYADYYRELDVLRAVATTITNGGKHVSEGQQMKVELYNSL
jgi:hypothetical protein